MKLAKFIEILIVSVCAVVTYIIVKGLIGLLLAFFLSSLIMVFIIMLKHEYTNRNINSFQGFIGQFGRLKPFFLILICALSLASFYLVLPINRQLYADLENIPLANWFRHISAILLTTFIPGYLILSIVDFNQTIKGLNKLIFAYILSIFSTFLLGYTVILSGNRISELGILAISIFNIAILLICSVFSIKRHLRCRNSLEVTDSGSVRTLDMEILCSMAFWLLVIGLVMVLTFGQYGTQIISDQQGHHGIALLFSSLQLPEDALAFPNYPWLFHIYAAMMFASSGIPSINAYNSFNFLNIMPVLAFYAMVQVLFKKYAHSSTIAAFSTFFAFFTSGFGWIYVLREILKGNAKLFSEIIYSAWVKTYDILTPNSFMVAGHPDVTTPLLLIELPAMFVLFQLSFADQMNISSRLKYFLIVATTVFGYLGHTETILIIGTILIVYLTRKDALKIYSSIFIALVVIYIINISSPNRYYSTEAVGILGYQFPFLLLLIVFTGFLSLCVVFHREISPNLSSFMSIIKQKVKSLVKRSHIFTFSIAVIYLYLLTFVIWAVVQPGFSVWSVFGYDGSVPWYFYPMRLGVVGLIALTGSLYWLSTKKIGYIKKLFPLYVWSFIILMFRNYYLEYRLIKHLYIPLSVIAGFVFYICTSKISASSIIVKINDERTRPSIYSVKIRGEHIVMLLLTAMVIISSASCLLCIRAVKDSDFAGVTSVLPRRQPFSEEELDALSWLRLNIEPMADTVLFIPDGRNLGSEVADLGGAWNVLSSQYAPIFEVSNPENLFDLFNKIQPKYLYINQEDRGILNSTKYTQSCIKKLIDYLPIAFNNSKVTIYKFPEFTPPLKSSSISLVNPSTILPDSVISLSNLNYSIIDKNDPIKYNSDVLILSDYPAPRELKEYLKWVKDDGHLIVLDFPPDPFLEKSYGARNGTLYGFNISSGSWSITNNGTIESTGGDILSGETIKNDYTVSTYAKSVQVKDPNDNHLGLLFNFKDKDNYYYVFLRQNQLVLFKNYFGIGRECYSVNVQRTDGAFQKLAVKVEAQRLSFYVNDTFVGKYLDHQFIEEGMVGLRVYRLVGDFLGLNIKISPIKISGLNGIIGNNTIINIPEMEVPFFNETFLSNETVSVDAYYTSHSGKKVPFSFTVTSERGKITYFNFQPLLNYLETSSDNMERSLLFSKLGELFRIVEPNLPYQQTISSGPEIEPICYIRGTTNSSGEVTLKTDSFWFVKQKPFYGTIDLSNTTKLEITEGKYEGLSKKQLFNATILNYTASGPAETIIKTSSFKITPSDSGVYAVMEIPDAFTWNTFLPNGTKVELTLSINDSVVRISVLGGSMNINVLNALLAQETSNYTTLKVYARYPLVQLNGQSFMESAYLSTSSTSVIVYGLPFAISGQISFRIDNIDQGTARISNLLILGETTSQKPPRIWNEWNIPWAQVITSPYNLILVILTLVVILYSWHVYANYEKLDKQ